MVLAIQQARSGHGHGCSGEQGILAEIPLKRIQEGQSKKTERGIGKGKEATERAQGEQSVPEHRSRGRRWSGKMDKQPSAQGPTDHARESDPEFSTGPRPEDNPPGHHRRVIKISPIREAGKHPIVGLVIDKLQLCSLPEIDGAPREKKSPPGYSREPPSDDDDILPCLW